MKTTVFKVFALALMLALLMVTSLAVSANTSENDASITINIGAGSNVSLRNRTFYAYKIFDVTNYGTGGYTYTITNEFQAFSGFPGTTLFDYIESQSDNSQAMNALARNLLNFIQTNSIAPAGTQTATANDSITISGLPHGYYLVSGTAMLGSGTITAMPALTTTSPAAIITLKSNEPTIRRQVFNHYMGGWEDWTSASIGDRIDYRILSVVPDMRGFSGFTFLLEERLDPALTFDLDSIVVKVGGVTTALGLDYRIDTNISPVLANFGIRFDAARFTRYTPGDDIEITYSGSIVHSGSAFIQRNMSQTALVFEGGMGTVRTPPSRTAIHNYQFDIYKYAGTIGVDAQGLGGAEFELRTDSNDPGSAIAFAVRQRSQTGNFYSHAALSDTNTSRFMTSSESGRIYIQGINAGVYYLHETVAPAGFNRLEQPIKVELIHTGNGEVSMSINEEPVNNRTVNVQNRAGTTLPETGGIGRTIFTITGLLMMGLSVVLFLWRRKRAEAK